MKINVKTEKKVQIIDITSRIEKKINIKKGICNIFVPHTTAGITINESEPKLLEDIKKLLKNIAPEDDSWKHNKIDNNADAHLRSIVLGSDLSVPVESGNLSLGSWQSVLFFEGDGPRNRKVTISTLET